MHYIILCQMMQRKDSCKSSSKLCEPQKRMDTISHRLTNLLLTYCTTPHPTTNIAPCTLFLQRQLWTQFHLLQPDCKQKVNEKQAEQVASHNQHAKKRNFVIGQEVVARSLLPGLKWVLGVIIQQLGPLTFLVQVESGATWRRHIDHLRARNGSDAPQPTITPDTDTDVFIPESFGTATQDSTPITNAEEEPTSDITTASHYPSRVCHTPDRL